MIPVQPPNLSNPLSPQGVSPLRLLTEGERALLDATILPQRLPSLVIGEQVTARIAEQLGNNQVAVLIKNALFTLSLPPGLQPKGDTLNLRVANLKPGLTFALVDSESAAEQGDTSVQVELSSASRYLTRLLSAADQDNAGAQGGAGGGSGKPAAGSSPEAAALAAARQPVAGGDAASSSPQTAALRSYDTGSGAGGEKLLTMLSGKPASPVALDARAQPSAQLATTLQHGVEHSGLFYESHLHAWDQGKLPLERLMQEPQARIGQALLQDVPQARSALHELGSQVQRQLDTLETQQVALQGVAWPGQPMQMVIEQERAEERQAHGDSEARAWTTHMALDLPVLGGLSARVRMVGKTVQVSFVTEEASAQTMIRNNSAKLQTGLEAAGLSLATLSVKHEEAES